MIRALARSPALWTAAALLVAPRLEVLRVVLLWSGMLVPAAWASRRLLGRASPLTDGFGALAGATVLGLAPFAAACLVGSILRLRLEGVWTIAVALALGLLAVLARISPPAAPAPETPPGPPSRTTGAAVTAAAATALLGVALATRDTASPGRLRVHDIALSRADWAPGLGLALVAGLVGALVLLRARRERTTAAPGRSGAPWLWIAALAAVTLVARTAHTVPAPGTGIASWDEDDASYVAEALDLQHGAALGRYEASLGGRFSMSRSFTSVLGAPLVATLSRATAIDPASLHHGVLPPLVVLLGASALAAVLAVLFRQDRWLVPLGLVAALLVIVKSHDHYRSLSTLLLGQTVQPKAVHLWVLQPLQLASAMLLVGRPDRRVVVAAVAVALVAHTVHPFATILGAVWGAAALAIALARRSRAAVASVALTLAVTAVLGAEFRWSQGRPRAEPQVSSDRVPGSPIESRDLVREGDRPRLRQEPEILFGCDLPFLLGTVALPFVLAIAVRRRSPEWALCGLAGGLAVAVCTTELLGRLVSVALPPPILWRARWIAPSLALAGALSALVAEAASALPRAGRTIGALASIAALAGCLGLSSARLVRPGPPPAPLSRFEPAVHGLVALLGGPRSRAYVWAPRSLAPVLPQVMPHVRLVFSRWKIMRPGARPDFRALVESALVGSFSGQLSAADLAALRAEYPIDHFVIDGRRWPLAHRLATTLSGSGWSAVGRSGAYEVWRLP